MRAGRLPVVRHGEYEAGHGTANASRCRNCPRPTFRSRAKGAGRRRLSRSLRPGIGGTGVVTINALLATAAWIDGLSVITLDQTGSAQKGGAVVSQLMLSERPDRGRAKIGLRGNADLILGFDLLGAASAEI